MNRELIVRSGSSEIDFALLKDGKLIELHHEKSGEGFAVGDIMLAKVKKPMQGLNAAFIDVGYEKDAFLHYHDLGPQLLSLLKFVKLVCAGKIRDFSLNDFRLEKEIDKDGNITQVLQANQSILVQIAKEPISTKGPRISSELSIAGRYMILIPFSDRVSVSQKIEDKEEKDRLKRLVQSIKPKGFGVIIRTVAEGKKVAELDKDLQNSLNRWMGLCKKIPKASFPSKVLSELNRVSSTLRDIFNDTFTGIYVDDSSLCHQIKEYVQEIAPDKEAIVKLYDSSIPIFEKFGIERQIKTSFGKTVSMSRGAYLIVEHTEALHVIDVNSGNQSNKAKTQEETALEVNLIAASEVARQLRLRDMGGIIVVDFIDMVRVENRKKLYERLQEEMAEDRAKHKILPPSKFGLIQITRQRVRPETNINTYEENPNVGGEVEAPIVIIGKITSDIEHIIQNHKDKNGMVLNVHPFVGAYLTKGIPSIRFKWFLEHRRWVRILPRDAYKYLEYHFKDSAGNMLS